MAGAGAVVCSMPCLPAALCYSMCTLTCYKDELGSNYSRIAPYYPESLARGGQVRISTP